MVKSAALIPKCQHELSKPPSVKPQAGFRHQLTQCFSLKGKKSGHLKRGRSNKDTIKLILWETWDQVFGFFLA